MKTLKEIKTLLKQHKEELRKRFKVREIGIFGSYLRGEQEENSDLDILVEFEEDAKLSLLGFIHLQNLLSDLLGVKVDLVEKNA